jgi:hypothetical protein
VYHTLLPIPIVEELLIKEYTMYQGDGNIYLNHA